MNVFAHSYGNGPRSKFYTDVIFLAIHKWHIHRLEYQIGTHSYFFLHAFYANCTRLFCCTSTHIFSDALLYNEPIPLSNTAYNKEH